MGQQASSQRGAALLMVLVMVVLLGLAASKAGQSWKKIMQREREQELLFRGEQYRRAIESYYNAKQGANQFPTKLEHLVSDPRFPDAVRHLRKLYPDPMTGKDWVLVKDPTNKVVGVRSSSELMPFKTKDFPEELEDLNDKIAYSEWEFVFKRPKAAGKSANAAQPPPKSSQPTK